MHPPPRGWTLLIDLLLSMLLGHIQAEKSYYSHWNLAGGNIILENFVLFYNDFSLTFLGKYYLYDGMIFPEVKSESFRKSFIGGIKSGWSQFTQLFWRQPEKSGQEEVKDSDIEKLAKPLAHEEAQARCLDMFSVTHRKKMISLDLSKLNFVILVNNISHIHEQLNRQRLCMDNARSNKERIARTPS